MECVMIIDDDPLVRTGLKYMLQQMPEVPQKIILCECGDDAIEIIRNEPCELVITDLKMPGIDGMEFIRQARMCCSNTKFIILSGYQSFDDAVMAIEYGVVQYLMKPVGQKELRDALELAQKALDLDKYNKMNERQNEFWKERMYQNWIENLLTNQRTDKDEIWRVTQTDSRIQQLDKNLYVCVCAPKNRINWERAADFLALYIEQEESSGLLLKSETLGLVILLPDRNCVERLYRHMLKKLDIKFILAVGIECKEIENVNQHYLRSAKLANYRILINESRLLWEELEPTEELPRDIVEKVRYVFAKLPEVTPKQAKTLIHSVVSSEVLREICIQSCETFVDIVNYSILNFCSEYIPQHMAYIVEKYGSLKSIYNYEDVQEYFKDLDDCLENICKLLPGMISPVMKEGVQRIEGVLDYLNKNYYKNINLRDVADMFSYNYSYFSWLFRHEVGVPFTDYLTNLRMEQAKKLLHGYHKNIKWVAEKVGYESTKNFSKAFKQYTGYTPQEYCKRKGEDT